jgi:ATP-binding cassette subfamily C (CFTR/MRP) protein 4
VIVILLLFGDGILRHKIKHNSLLFFSVTSVGNIGLVLSQSFMLVQIQQLGFFRWAKLETNMTAVNRILEYTKVKEEPKDGSPIANWPKTGDIRFEEVEFSYKNDSNFVLKQIHFSIKSGEKIGIVGRTGAGKTSLVSTLLRLYKTQGMIYFDDVDIATLPLDLVRKNISIVPQNPFLFTGTIRENIDPLGRYADEQVWNVIKTINLENLFCNLEHKISGDDCSLSVGQKQLICLGRAVIQSNKLVILDEVTANVDSEIETKIQQIIKTHFSRSTVIMITHKLDFIKDCDKIMVLDKGSIVEFDSRQVLLENDKGMLHKMYTFQ